MTSLLIVDDDKTFCTVLAESMNRRGHETRTAHNVVEAVAIADEFTPEWALVDLKMPGASGLELIPKLLGANRLCRNRHRRGSYQARGDTLSF